MLERRRRKAFRIISFSSKPELDLQTGSGQNVPAPQHCSRVDGAEEMWQFWCIFLRSIVFFPFPQIKTRKCDCQEPPSTEFLTLKHFILLYRNMQNSGGKRMHLAQSFKNPFVIAFQLTRPSILGLLFCRLSNWPQTYVQQGGPKYFSLVNFGKLKMALPGRKKNIFV